MAFYWWYVIANTVKYTEGVHTYISEGDVVVKRTIHMQRLNVVGTCCYDDDAAGILMMFNHCEGLCQSQNSHGG